MEAVQLFLHINKPNLNNEWNEKITSSLNAYCAIENVLVIEENESSNTQININYDMEKASLGEIELLVKNSSAIITEINIHFLSSVSRVTSHYGASAIALALEDRLKIIKGIIKGGISSNGDIKILPDPNIENKQYIIEQIINNISIIKAGK